MQLPENLSKNRNSLFLDACLALATFVLGAIAGCCWGQFLSTLVFEEVRASLPNSPQVAQASFNAAFLNSLEGGFTMVYWAMRLRKTGPLAALLTFLGGFFCLLLAGGWASFLAGPHGGTQALELFGTAALWGLSLGIWGIVDLWRYFVRDQPPLVPTLVPSEPDPPSEP